MKLRHVYLALCLLGVLLPYWQFAPWLLAHGFDLPLLVRELFANRVSGFFALDVVVSALALLVFIFAEPRSLSGRVLWLPVIALLTVGVSLGLPLFLYLRQRRFDHAQS